MNKELIWSDENSAAVLVDEKIKIFLVNNPGQEDGKIYTEYKLPVNYQKIHEAKEARDIGINVHIPNPVFQWNDPPRSSMKTLKNQRKEMIRKRVFNLTNLIWEYPGLDYPEIGPVRISTEKIAWCVLRTTSFFLPTNWDMDPGSYIRKDVPKKIHKKLDELHSEWSKKEESNIG